MKISKTLRNGKWNVNGNDYLIFDFSAQNGEGNDMGTVRKIIGTVRER